MKNLLALLAAVIVIVAGVGWYLDWYKISTVPTDEGKHQVTIDVNSPKISDDIKKGRAKIKKILEENSENEETASEPSSTEAKPFPPQQSSGEFELSEDGFFVLPPPPPATRPVEPIPFSNSSLGSDKNN